MHMFILFKQRHAVTVLILVICDNMQLVNPSNTENKRYLSRVLPSCSPRTAVISIEFQIKRAKKLDGTRILVFSRTSKE